MTKHCFKCEGKGFIEYTMAFSNTHVNTIQQCPECKDIVAYSNEVKRRMGKTPGLELVKPQETEPLEG